MIPKKIWQTYKTDFDNLPECAIQPVRTWIDRNPDWEYNYFNDDDMMDFVFDNYGSEWVDIFNSCLVPVMKADIWRVMILQVYGGLYADVDTICNVPLSKWFDDLQNYKMIVSAEHELHFQQWTFLSDKENPVLDRILFNMKGSLDNKEIYKNPNFVHHTTGPLIFTKSILEYLGMWEKTDYPPSGKFTFYQNDGSMSERSFHKLNLITDVEEINSSRSSLDAGFYILPQYMSFEKSVVSHLFGSLGWNDGSYNSWLKDKNAIVNSS